MKYNIQIWTIGQLLDLIKQKRINLQPDYQRNSIWTQNAQINLIKNINAGLPIPNFFLHERKSEKFDVTDGQQRSRAIISYFKGLLKNPSLEPFEIVKEEFLSYEICVIIISKTVAISRVRDFYYEVNNSGLKLNRPESFKGKFYNTSLLECVETLISEYDFVELGIFSERQQQRMLDREYAEELFAFLKKGITDKKTEVKKMYERDSEISSEEIEELSFMFRAIMDKVLYLNKIYPLRETRYSQKNDFYTLFSILHENQWLNKTQLKFLYKVLRSIELRISPSEEKCIPLKEYAVNCITQSNSKSARIKRKSILENLFFGTRKSPNSHQKSVIKYLDLKKELKPLGNYYSISK